MNLTAKIAARRSKMEAERRAELLDQGVYFNESAWWWFGEALNWTKRDATECRKAALESATAAHLSALTLIILENTP